MRTSGALPLGFGFITCMKPVVRAIEPEHAGGHACGGPNGIPGVDSHRAYGCLHAVGQVGNRTGDDSVGELRNAPLDEGFLAAEVESAVPEPACAHGVADERNALATE